MRLVVRYPPTPSAAAQASPASPDTCGPQIFGASVGLTDLRRNAVATTRIRVNSEAGKAQMLKILRPLLRAPPRCSGYKWLVGPPPLTLSDVSAHNEAY
jgi:hypothetical protein